MTLRDKMVSKMVVYDNLQMGVSQHRVDEPTYQLSTIKAEEEEHAVTAIDRESFEGIWDIKKGSVAGAGVSGSLDTKNGSRIYHETTTAGKYSQHPGSFKQGDFAQTTDDQGANDHEEGESLVSNSQDSNNRNPMPLQTLENMPMTSELTENSARSGFVETSANKDDDAESIGTSQLSASDKKQ